MSSIDCIDDGHRNAFRRAISRVLSTEIAEVTYAQIVDGLPLADVADDSVDGGPPRGHPLRQMHRNLCPGVLDKTKEFLARFNVGALQFNPQVSN